MTKHEKEIIIEEYKELKENNINLIGSSIVSFVEKSITEINYMAQLMDKLGLSKEREQIDKEYKIIGDKRRKELFPGMY